MLISLFSDASLCHIKRVGGWAAWLKSDRGATRTGGHFRTTINDTTIAEAMAVVNGMAAGISIGLICHHDTLLIQTDNNGVMGVLNGTAQRRITAAVRRRRGISWSQLRRDARYHNAEIELVAQKFQQFVELYQIRVLWRHVKGHQKSHDKRSAVNNFCDETARFHMKQARKKKIRPRPHPIPTVATPPASALAH